MTWRGLRHYVTRMKDEALSQGITLRVERLLKCDQEMLRSVQDAFVEVEEIRARAVSN